MISNRREREAKLHSEMVEAFALLVAMPGHIGDHTFRVVHKPTELRLRKKAAIFYAKSYLADNPHCSLRMIALVELQPDMTRCWERERVHVLPVIDKDYLFNSSLGIHKAKWAQAEQDLESAKRGAWYVPMPSGVQNVRFTFEENLT